jgi:hypothetical protein
MKPGLPGSLGGGGFHFDPEIVSCRALVIDANPRSRLPTGSMPRASHDVEFARCSPPALER